jgi:hypothetical protein
MRALHATFVALALVAAAPALAGCSRPSTGSEGAAASVPELQDRAEAWVNGAPVTFAAARGSVVLVEAWHPT